jgi:hypothetical protein
MVKRIFSILVLILFLAHFAGFYIYFVVQLKQVRQEMRNQLRTLPTEELELLTFTPEEFQIARVEEKEVKVDGKMYDIARLEKQGNTILVYCLHDIAEDNLLAFLNKILTLPLKDSHVPNGILHFCSLNYLPTLWGFKVPEVMPTTPFTAYTEMISEYSAVIAAPPPKVQL